MGNQYSLIPNEETPQLVPGDFKDDSLNRYERVITIHHHVSDRRLGSEETSSDGSVVTKFPMYLSSPYGMSITRGPVYNSSEQIVGLRTYTRENYCHYCYDLLPKCGKFVVMDGKECDVSFSEFTKENPLALWKLVGKDLVMSIPNRYDYVQFIACNVSMVKT